MIGKFSPIGARMDYFQWRPVIKSMAVLGLLTANTLWPSLPVIAPGLTLQPRGLAAGSSPQSLADLYQLRDQLQATQPTVASASFSSLAVSPEAALAMAASDSLWALHHRIYHEELAQRQWQQAAKVATSARTLGDPATLPDESVETAYTRWTQALEALAEVPPMSFAAQAAVAQAQPYRQNLAILAYRYDTLRSGFLAELAAQTGDAERVRMTVCDLKRECRRWLGHRPPANPASLIKLPVAVALMAKLHQEGIDRDTPLWVNPGNWTEDAGSTRVRTEYALGEIMADMVSASGNVATNQLIDYLGWEGVNQYLRDRGYRATRITTKLVGERTYPANAGSAPNVLTTDELTDMMVGIYNQEHPGDDLIQAALANQRDILLGKTALRPPMIWLGEKTGRNSKVLGSTTAVMIGGQPYVITITIDHSANEAAMRTLIAGVAQHLLTHNGFEQTHPAPNLDRSRPRTFLP